MMTSTTTEMASNVARETDDLSKAEFTSIDDSIKFMFDLSEVHGKTGIQKFKLALKRAHEQANIDLCALRNDLREATQLADHSPATENRNVILNPTDELGALIKQLIDTNAMTNHRLAEVIEENKQMRHELADIKKEMTDLKQAVKTQIANKTTNNTNGMGSYAERLKQGLSNVTLFSTSTPISESKAVPPQPTPEQHVVLVQPRKPEEVKSSDVTQRLIRIKLNHKVMFENEICIKRTERITKNRVLLHCGSRKEGEKLQELLREDKDIEVIIPKKKKNLVRIHGIDLKIEKREILNYMRAGNAELRDLNEDTVFEVTQEQLDRTKESKFVTAKTDPMLFEKLTRLQGGIVSIGGRPCLVHEHVPVIQCYKCQGFGHIATDCNNPNEVCAHCAGEHRTSVHCSHATKKCVNCEWVNSKIKNRGNWNENDLLPTNHSANDTGCPQQRKMYQIVRNQYHHV